MPLEEKSAISRIKTSIIKDIFWCSKAKPYNHSAFGFELAVFYPNEYAKQNVSFSHTPSPGFVLLQFKEDMAERLNRSAPARSSQISY